MPWRHLRKVTWQLANPECGGICCTWSIGFRIWLGNNWIHWLNNITLIGKFYFKTIFEIHRSISCIQFYAGWTDKAQGKIIEVCLATCLSTVWVRSTGQTTEDKLAYTSHEPCGVVVSNSIGEISYNSTASHLMVEYPHEAVHFTLNSPYKLGISCRHEDFTCTRYR